MSRSLYLYEAERPDDVALKMLLIAQVWQKRLYGYRRLHALLHPEGWAINWKGTYRMYRDTGLAVRRCKRRHIAGVERQPNVMATAPNSSW